MFRLTTRRHQTADQPPLVVVEVDGEIDVTSAAAFAEAIDNLAEPRPVVLDLTRLTYVDSAGFAVLDRMLRYRTTAVAAEPHSPIRAAARLVGLPVHDTVDDAARAAHNHTVP